MSQLSWQQSSYCSEGNSCIGVADRGGGSLLLRESDVPGVVLTATPEGLRGLIARVKAGGGAQKSTRVRSSMRATDS
ncbi:DUF397 domain-containing protein [Streptomyces sp. MST-110588]|uniref:DUF397 domain-containing protein n=1 Tax=Streptomyces sp. MST-110588 TaxID=2833628 RepID=UPI001F5C63D0|nr:DUF397 domain-containing protein [Streptomyces sp. MST-110588]UNO40491.1 DUF397 domain-containing protein [Streptomyces sp. MST-110588]